MDDTTDFLVFSDNGSDCFNNDEVVGGSMNTTAQVHANSVDLGVSTSSTTGIFNTSVQSLTQQSLNPLDEIRRLNGLDTPNTSFMQRVWDFTKDKLPNESVTNPFMVSQRVNDHLMVPPSGNSQVIRNMGVNTPQIYPPSAPRTAAELYQAQFSANQPGSKQSNPPVTSVSTVFSTPSTTLPVSQGVAKEVHFQVPEMPRGTSTGQKSNLNYTGGPSFASCTSPKQKDNFRIPSNQIWKQSTSNLRNGYMTPTHSQPYYNQPRFNISDQGRIDPAERVNSTYDSRDRANVPILMSRGKYTPMSRWGIVFRGDGTGLSVSDFFSQIEMKSEGLRMTSEEMMGEFSDILEGPAKIWYRAYFRYFTNWSELKTAMRREFLPPDYDFLLKRQIEDRVQGRDESFGLFRANMYMLFDALTVPITDSEKLSILLRNMDIFYLEKINPNLIHTVGDLTNFCTQQELTKAIITRRRGNQLVTVEPAFQSPANIISERRAGRHVNQVFEMCPDQQKDNRDYVGFGQTPMCELFALNTTRTPKCWNCDTIGHTFRDCKLPRQRLFCFACGKVGIIKQNCERCSGNRYPVPKQ